MNTPINVVKLTSVSITPHEFQLKGFLGLCFNVIYRIYLIWFWFQRFQLYTNPDNFLKLAAGHTVNWLAADNVFVRIAARAAIIGARLSDHINEQIALVKKVNRLWSLIRDPLIIKKVKLPVLAPRSCISPSTIVKWKKMIAYFFAKISKILLSLYQICKGLFQLSMKTINTIESFSYGEKVRRQSVNELFINSSMCLEVLVQNKQLLLTCIKKNKAVIEALLKQTCSLFDANQLISGIEKTVQVAEKIHHGIESTSKAVGIIGQDLGKQGLFGIFQAAGLTDLMPHSWVPSPTAPWMNEEESENPQDRFPPLALMRQHADLGSLVKAETLVTCAPYKPNSLGYNILRASTLANLQKKYNAPDKMKKK